MVPFGGELSTARYLDDGLGDGLTVWVDTAIADNVVRVDVLNWLKTTTESHSVSGGWGERTREILTPL